MHDDSMPLSDLYIPVLNRMYSDGGTGEEVDLFFMAIGGIDLKILATIKIRVWNPDTGVIDMNSNVNIDIKRYFSGEDYISKYIATSNTPTL